MHAHLEGRGVPETVATAVIDTLSEQGYLDDARFAERFAADRRSLDHWGAERIERRLGELGVSRELVAGALVELRPGNELQAALDLLERRFPEPPRDDRGRNRALGLLVRRGYELELAHDALRLHSGSGSPGS